MVRTTVRLMIHLSTTFLLVASGSGQSVCTSSDPSCEQLKGYISDLQTKPDDRDLREKIIKLVQTMKPAPEIPEDARRHFVKAATIQKESKDAQALDLAITEYKQALLTAPWWAEAHYNLGVASEQAGRFDTAIDALKLYLLTNPSATEAREAQDRLYAIEGKKDLAARNAAADAEAARKKEQVEIAKRGKLFSGLAGRWVINTNYMPENPTMDNFMYYELTVSGNLEFTLKWVRSYAKNFNGESVHRPYEEVYRISADGAKLEGTVARLSDFSAWKCGIRQWTEKVTGTLSESEDAIHLLLTEPEFDFRSCDFSGRTHELRYTAKT